LVFELEADATIPAEYVLLQHYLGTPEPDLERRIARYLQSTQAEHGAGRCSLAANRPECDVKAYFALKAAGDPIDAPHMQRARAAILARGGASRCNVFTRILLALFGEVPWNACRSCRSRSCCCQAVPVSHRQDLLLSRTVLVPLLVLMALRPKRAIRMHPYPELFTEPPETVRHWILPRRRRRPLCLHIARPHRAPCRANVPGGATPPCDREAVTFVTERPQR